MSLIISSISQYLLCSLGYMHDRAHKPQHTECLLLNAECWLVHEPKLAAWSADLLRVSTGTTSTTLNGSEQHLLSSDSRLQPNEMQHVRQDTAPSLLLGNVCGHWHRSMFSNASSIPDACMYCLWLDSYTSWLVQLGFQNNRTLLYSIGKFSFIHHLARHMHALLICSRSAHP